MIVKISECLDKKCFKPGDQWGHLRNMFCKYIGESDTGITTICNKPKKQREGEIYDNNGDKNINGI